jgi:hypothetical protein
MRCGTETNSTSKKEWRVCICIKRLKERGVRVYCATAVVRGIARFADVGLQYLGVAEDDQTGKMMMIYLLCDKRLGVGRSSVIAEGSRRVMI